MCGRQVSTPNITVWPKCKNDVYENTEYQPKHNPQKESCGSSIMPWGSFSRDRKASESLYEDVLGKMRDNP